MKGIKSMARAAKTPEMPAQKQNSKRPSGLLQNVQGEVKPLQTFITKFNNDWVMNFSGMLAYNLLLSIFPILLALVSIFGIIVGGGARKSIVTSILSVLPAQVSADVVNNALLQLNKASGFLGIVAIVSAIFFGSRLFITIEGCFDIIYHIRPRTLIPQNLMAIGMLLIFIILIPIMIFTSTLPTLATTLLKPVFGQIPFVASVVGILAGLASSFLLFETIYVVIPNQKISIRHSWLGALVAAIALEIYLLLFPLYVQHFLNGYAGQVGFAIVLLVFFYYFAVILLIGAEINAFFSEKVQPLPNDLATFVSTMGGRLNKDRPDVESSSHVDPKPTNKADEHHASEMLGGQRNTALGEQQDLRGQKNTEQGQQQKQQEAVPQDTNVKRVKVEKAKDKKQSSRGVGTLPTVIEVIIGSALAFVIELLRIRRHAR